MSFPSLIKMILIRILILTQVLGPYLAISSSAAYADEYSNMQSTVDGLNSLILNGEFVTSAPAPDGRGIPVVKEDKNNSSMTENSLGSDRNKDFFKKSTLKPSDADKVMSGLPELSYPKSQSKSDESLKNTKENNSDNDNEYNKIASKLTQAGRIFSNNNPVDAGINYAKSVGAGLINQQVNDWLNQYGNAKISFGTDKTISGDLLLPVMESNNNLLFSQLGVRTNDERNTVNIGAGYRQYVNDLMLGVNAFYDYDYTGKNSRLGVGAEAWADYLKLAVNGYFGLTDWHQSRLYAMRDYDEKPANGFDIRAEAYLPQWPALGASLMYEKYYGKAVSINHSTSYEDLKNDPSVFTLGVNYTPIPLVKISASHSVGDSNDTRLGLDFVYRFGVPLYQQLSSASADLLRSLAGSKYDFVDRNYNIVMQYRKQDLLLISLPERMAAKADETITVPMSLVYTKYGLKSVDWSLPPEFIARGGSYKVVSTDKIEVRLPAYIFDGGNNGPQEYRISAIATDVNGNKSNTAVTTIGVSPSANVISSFVLTPNSGSLPANDADYYTGVVTVVDENGQPLAGQPIAFKINGLDKPGGGSGATLTSIDGSQSDKSTVSIVTESDGKASIFLRSSAAGRGALSATMRNGNSSNATALFTGDMATASVRTIRLIDSVTSKTADGNSKFTYAARVTDDNGNPLSGVTINWSHDKGTIVSITATSTTDNAGNATATLTSTTRPAIDVTVNAETGNQSAASSADKTVSFTAGAANAAQTTFTVTPASIVANGTAESMLTVVLKDANGNLLTGQAGSLGVSVANVTDTTVSAFTESTTSPGTYTAKLTGKKAGVARLTANLSGTKVSNTTPTVTLTADATTARVSTVTLNDAATSKMANGTNTFTYTAQVNDANGNPVSGETVTWTQDKGTAVSVTPTSITDSTGKATGILTSTTTAVASITVKGKAGTLPEVSADKTVSFSAGTASAAQTTFTVTPASIVANNTAESVLTVVLKDANGNVLTGQAGSLGVSVANVTDTTVSAFTESTTSPGTYTAKLTGKKAGVATLTANLSSAKISNTTPTVTLTADATTARVSTVTLDGTDTSKMADKVSTFTYTAQVNDANGNPVSGETVTWTQDKGAAVSVTPTSITDRTGKATATLSHTTSAANILVKGKAGTLPEVPADKTVSFIAGTASAAQTTFTVTPASIVANDTAESVLTVVLKDANGNLLAGQAGPLGVSVANVTDTTVSAFTESTTSPGTYTAKLTGKKAGVATLTANLSGAKVSNTTPTVTLTADATTARVSTVTLNDAATSKMANGTNTFTYTAQVNDANGNPVSGETVTWTQDKGAAVSVTPTSITDSTGKATGTLTSTTTAVASVTVKGKAGTLPEVSADKTVSFTAGTASAAQTTFTVTPASIVANDTAESVLTVVLKDANGNELAGQAGSLGVSVANVTDTTVSAFTESTTSPGTYTAKLTGKKAGVATLTANLSGTMVSTTTPTVTLTADATTARVSTVTLNGTDISKVANGTNTFTYTAQVNDANGNPVSGETVTWTQDKGTTVSVTPTSITDSTGKATGTLTSTTTAVASVTMKGKAGILPEVSADKTVAFFTYSFDFVATRSRIVEGGTFQYAVKARASNAGATDPDESVTGSTWSTSNVSTASIANGLVTGIAGGTVTVTASGMHNGLPYNITTTLNVEPPVYSKIYGARLASDNTQPAIIKPPSYELAFRCGWIVDAMGTREDIVGGAGGNAVTLANLRDIVSVVVSTAPYQFDNFNTTITKLAFNYANGTSTSCGTGSVNTPTSIDETFTIPAGQTIQGFEISGGTYIHAIRFITIPNI